MTTTTRTTRTLEVPGATLTYDVRGPLPTVDGQPVLLLIGQPMDASGFGTLASFFPDRTVVTYDPRGLGRSVRSDGTTLHDPVQQAEDLHRLVGALESGPVDLFGSSGGAVTALQLVTAYPQDVRVVVVHEPPMLTVLPDAELAVAASRRVDEIYQERGWGWGMAMFIALTSWQGEFTAGFGAEPADPATFGLPTQDDGSRDDPLMSGASAPVTSYVPDVPALSAVATRVVVAAGIESRGILTWRASEVLAGALGQELTVFPSNHGGFLGGEYGQQGEPEAFAARLREVLDAEV
ncbi:alpha/beta fold hydrolase [Actinotalea sp. K2]|uniref:alpha/beta fold hydrolase n=1 Tax=Actinotalea sp. K2 TaxID=2939438 RepID=UPI002016AB1C|nr:alpha/beta hydrolase [Actinotalea sp. K2]MCL3862484.1 alpha/beta hydrolase [Actinotalea sp. K2]